MTNNKHVMPDTHGASGAKRASSGQPRYWQWFNKLMDDDEQVWTAYDCGLITDADINRIGKNAPGEAAFRRQVTSLANQR